MQPRKPEGLRSPILKGFVSLIKKALLSLEKGTCEAVFRFILLLLALSGGMHLRRDAHVPICRKCLSASGQVSCPVSAFAGDGQSTLPNFLSVFIDCGLALGSDHSSEHGQCQRPSLNRGTAAPALLCSVLSHGDGAARLRNMWFSLPWLGMIFLAPGRSCALVWGTSIQLNSRLGRHFVLDLLRAAASPNLFLSLPSVSDNVQSY